MLQLGCEQCYVGVAVPEGGVLASALCRGDDGVSAPRWHISFGGSASLPLYEFVGISLRLW
jgi:hypothetical protein